MFTPHVKSRELGVKSNRCHRYKVLPGIKYFPVPTHPLLLIEDKF